MPDHFGCGGKSSTAILATLLDIFQQNIKQVVNKNTAIPPIAIAAAIEFANPKEVEALMRTGKWPRWASIKQPDEASIQSHEWYHFRRSPTIPSNFSLDGGNQAETGTSAALPSSGGEVTPTLAEKVAMERAKEKGKGREVESEWRMDVDEEHSVRKGNEKGIQGTTQVKAEEAERGRSLLRESVPPRTQKARPSHPTPGPSHSHPDAATNTNADPTTNNPRCERCEKRDVPCIPWMMKGVCEQCKRLRTKCSLTIP